MEIKELFGKKITRIFEIYNSEPYGLDKCEMFLELDNLIIIDIPWHNSENIWVKKLSNSAKEIINELDKILNNKIIAFISYPIEPSDKAFIELENGIIISEQTIAPNGTGLAGLHIYNSIKDIESKFGTNFSRVTIDSKL